MAAKSKNRSAQPGGAGEEAHRGAVASLLKWVGVVTALISLALGIVQVTSVAAEVRERARQVREALENAAQQRSSGDEEAAWLTLEQATKSADEGGQFAKLFGRLDEQRTQLRRAQEEVAMEWVRKARPREGQTFAEIVDKVLPVLERGALSASGVRKADLLAHTGWGYFLKGRDTPVQRFDPAVQYREAVALDPANPYAHVYLGHWILWQRGPAEEARKHFDAAVAGHRDLSYVRQIELAALENDLSGDSNGEFLRVVNEMRIGHEPIDATAASDVWTIYYFMFSGNADFGKVKITVPAADQVALIQALYYGPDFEGTKIPSREAYRAIFEEAAGQREEALQRWRALRATFPTRESGPLVSSAESAIERLSHPVAPTP